MVIAKYIQYLIFGLIVSTGLIKLSGVVYGLPLILDINEFYYVNNVYTGAFIELAKTDFYSTSYFIFRGFLFIHNILGIGSFFSTVFESSEVNFNLAIITLRFFNVLISLLTVIPVYLVARSLTKNQLVAIIAALIFLFIPENLIGASTVSPYTIGLFWLIWSIYFFFRIFDSGSVKDFVFFGIFYGLAVGSNPYSSLYLIFFVLLAISNNPDQKAFNFISKGASDKINLRSVFLAILGFGVSYFTFNYWALLNSIAFISGALNNLKSLVIPEYSLEIYLETFTNNFILYPISSLGWPLYFVIVLMSIGFLFFPYRSLNVRLTLGMLLLFYFLISIQNKIIETSEFIFLSPLIAIAAAIGISDLSNYLGDRIKIDSMQYHKGLIILSSILIGSMFIGGVLTSSKLAGGDTRTDLYASMPEYLGEEIRIYYYGSDLAAIPIDGGVEYIDRIDDENISIRDFPFYLIIGVDDVDYDEFIDNKSHDNVRGRTSTFLENSELISFIDNKKRYGPPIYVFKVFSIDE